MKFLQSPLFWLAIVLLVVVGGGLIKSLARRRELGFHDYVKNPELWTELEEAHRKIGRDVDAAATWNDEQVATAVRRFVFDAPSSREAWGHARVLEALGPRTHPTLMQILNDKSLHSKLITPTGKDILPEAPFNRVCDLLGHDPPAEFAPLFTPFLDDPSKEIRKDAALVLGNIGTETIIAPVRKALLDPDEYVRSYALIGFERARAEQRLGDSCRQELFPDLQRLLSEGQNGDKAASLLLEFDEQQAMNFFLSEAVFTPKFMSLHDVLHALNEKRLLIPRDRLLALIEELETDEQKYPRTYQLGEALQSLGRHQVHDDQAILVKHLEHAGEIVAEGAAFGLAALNGLEGFRDRIWATLRRRASLP